MNLDKVLPVLLSTIVLTVTLGCASTSAHEGSGEYVDDSDITTTVKAAIFDDPVLEVSEFQVKTFKGVVSLSDLVSSRDNINHAVTVASAVSGLKSVSNAMRLQ